MRQSGVGCLLMGGQACVLYGAAEFSKDVDFAVVSDPKNLENIRDAMSRLDARVIAVPPFEREHLEAGLAVHFRCEKDPVRGLRVDIMSKMRGVPSFAELWDRRTSIDDGHGTFVELLSLRDLVAAKKTQRDKDWPMIQRLMETSYLSAESEPPDGKIRFWMRELRTPELLFDVVARFQDVARELSPDRPLLRHAIKEDRDDLSRALEEEMRAEKERDRIYWKPLKRRLSELRRDW